MRNLQIKEHLEVNYGLVIKVIERMCRDGLISGTRIVTVENSVLQANPIPSYITIDGQQIYVSYVGQQLTCKYCGNEGHKQAECLQRAKDFP